MLYSTITPAVKRAQLRKRLSSGALLAFPGAFNALSARLIQQKGFDGVYVSGAVVSADLGLPDIGLTTLSEVADRSMHMTRMIDLPSIVDADTGFGESLNVARTVQTLEDAGVSGLHIEDQVNPKRCGHLEGKHIVSLDDAVERIRAAVSARRDPNLLIIARTDARAVDGLPAVIERAKAFRDAGADAIFPEALESLSEFETVCSAVDAPVLANMTEFGKSDLFNRQHLEAAGVALVIYPVSLLRLAMGAAARGLDTLLAHGSLESELTHMHRRADLYDLVDYAGYGSFDESVTTFRASRAD